MNGVCVLLSGSCLWGVRQIAIARVPYWYRSEDVLCSDEVLTPDLCSKSY
jgi:hypothetical protein